MENEENKLEEDILTEIEAELENGGDEDVSIKPETHLEEENYEVGDTNIQEE